jgi:mannose-6-phosphate isomerase-like protein (cupin superfamily)
MSKPHEEIAPRIFGLRDAMGLSVEEVAAKTGYTPEEVKSFESGRAEIPVSFLFEMAKVCGVDTTALISGGEAHLKNYTLVRAGDGLSVDRRKDYAYASLAYRFVGRRMEPFIVTAPPKPAEDLSFSHHPGQEFIYLIEGRLEITLGDKALVLEEGDSLYFDSRTPHGLRGLDEKPAKFLDVII